MKKRVLKSAGSLLLVFVLVLSMGIGTFAVTFTDVSGHWAETYILKWAEEGVVNGYKDGTFRPGNDITRAEAATAVCRFLKLDTNKAFSNPYNDVDKNMWYYNYIMACYEANVMIGYGDGRFGPEDHISRQDAITALARAVNLKTGDMGAEKFSDGGQVAAYALGYVNAMIRDGYVNGYQDNTLRPMNNINRAEFVKTLYYVNAPISVTNPNTTYKLYAKVEDTLGKSLTASTSSYLVPNDLVAYEFVSLIDSQRDSLRELFPSEDMRKIGSEGLAAFSNGDSAWSQYVAKYFNDVDENYYGTSFIDIMRNRNSKLGDLVAGIQYQMTFNDTAVGRENVVYTVTVWVERT